MKSDKRSKDGLSSFCKACHTAASVAWQKANPEKLNAGRRARYERKKQEINAARKASYDYEKMRWERLKYLYSASKEWYESKLEAQGGVCAVCKRSPDEFKCAFSVDHDHSCCAITPTCGKCNRGILCHSCNTSLHALERDLSWVDSALKYIGEKK